MILTKYETNICYYRIYILELFSLVLKKRQEKMIKDGSWPSSSVYVWFFLILMVLVGVKRSTRWDSCVFQTNVKFNLGLLFHWAQGNLLFLLHHLCHLSPYSEFRISVLGNIGVSSQTTFCYMGGVETANYHL